MLGGTVCAPPSAWGVEHLEPRRAALKVDRRRRRPVRRRGVPGAASSSSCAAGASARPGSTTRCGGSCATSSGSACSTIRTSTRTRAEAVVGARRVHRRAGSARSDASIVLLANAQGVLPLASGTRIYVEGVDAAVAAELRRRWSSDPEDADVRDPAHRQAPFEPRDGDFLEQFFHAGRSRLRRRRERERILDVARARADGRRHLPRPAGRDSRGRGGARPCWRTSARTDARRSSTSSSVASAPTGRLPFELPSSMAGGARAALGRLVRLRAIRSSRSGTGSRTSPPRFVSSRGRSSRSARRRRSRSPRASGAARRCRRARRGRRLRSRCRTRCPRGR